MLLIKILTIVNSYTYNKTIVHPHIDIMANVFKPYQPKPAKKNETKIANHVRSCFQLLSIIQVRDSFAGSCEENWPIPRAGQC